MEDTSLAKSMSGCNVIIICGNDEKGTATETKSMKEISDQAIFKSILVWVLIMVDWVESSISGSEYEGCGRSNHVPDKPQGGSHRNVSLHGKKDEGDGDGILFKFHSNFYKSKTLNFAQEAHMSDTKSTKQEKSIGWAFCLVLFLVFTTGPKGVRCEDIGNPLVPGSTAMNSLLANKYLRGDARHLAAAIDYKVFSHGYHRSNTTEREKVNSYERPHNPEDHYRQGNTGKHQ